MLKLNVLQILENKGKSKYWLFSQLNLTYPNFNNLVTNKTKSIKYEHIEKLCDILECTPSDLFIKLPDPPDANKKTTKKKTVKSKKSKSKQTKNNNSENEQSQTENLKSDSETIDLNSKIES